MKLRALFLLLSLVTAAGGLLVAAPVAAAAGLPTIAGSWSAVPPMPSSFTPMTAVGGHDGRIYVFGFRSSDDKARTYIYNPATAKWKQGRSAPQSCSGAQASVVGRDGRIRLAGCWKDMVTDAGFRMAIYDPAADSWTMKRGHGPYVNPIAGMSGPGGRMSWFSETLRNDGSAVFVSGHRVVERRNGRWHARARLHTDVLTGPSDGATFGGDGRIWVLGGSRNCFPDIQTCQVRRAAAWTPRSDVWSRPTKVPTPRIKVAVTADAGGRIFVAGGLKGDASATYRTVEVFMPRLHSWAKAADLPSKRFGAIATSTRDGRVWVLAGYDMNGNPLSNGYVFTP
jgi:hypothetical protein